ncbi:MAG: hypothetical protein ABIZ91_19910 [Gemmatimonadaceae bacterium]
MKKVRWDLTAALLLITLHIIAVWGYTGVFWGDIGRWSHEVERLAHGEMPYRDFQWHYPPLGLWLEAMAARVIGTDRAQLSAIASSFAVLIVLTSVRYARQVQQRTDAALVAVGLVLALAYAQRIGPPLPMGLYSPGFIVGTLFIALAASFFVKSLDSEEPRAEDWMGFFAALAVLCKQDFWIPAAFMVGTSVIRSRRLAPAIISAAVTAVGVAVIIRLGGVGILLPLAGGFGHAEVAGGQGLPSWESLTVDLLVLSLVCGTYALLASLVARRVYWRPLVVCAVVAAAFGGLHLYMSLQVTLPAAGEFARPTQSAMAYQLRRGESLLRPAIGWLRQRLGQDPLPVALPLLLLVAMARRWQSLPAPRRATVAILLGLAFALRARRGFQGTEWFEFLFTLPVVLVAAEMLLAWPDASRRRLRHATVAVLAVAAVWANWEHGRGAGTKRYSPETTLTLRGPMHWKQGEARDYHALLSTLNALDSTGQRPAFAFGVSGGLNYFLKRRNPFPFTQNFFFSAFNVDSILQHRPDGVILIDNRMVGAGSFAAFDWRRWEGRRVSAPYEPYDRPRFDRLKAGCRAIPNDSTPFRVYDCP